MKTKKLKYDHLNQKIYDLIPKKTTVLDLGCASGKLGHALKSKKGCFVVGIEKDKKSGEIAKKCLDRFILADLEKINLEKKLMQKFEVIVLGDVLEHLKTPDLLLKKLTPLLKKGGRLIISLPNSVHISNRIHVLLGKFEYEKYGLRDKTHLHFFTYSSFKKILKNHGFKIIKTEAIHGGFKSRSIRFTEKLFFFIFKHFKNLFAYEFAIVAKKIFRPKVSVIIALYNGGKYIEATLKSILFGGYKNIEILIVDDGSTDRSASIVKKWAKKYRNMRYFYQENTGSPVAGRIKGINLSRGKYIAFCDQDDLWTKNKLDNEMKLFEKKQDLGLVFSEANVLLPNGKIISYKTKIPKNLNENNQLSLLIKKNFVPAASAIFKKELLKETGSLDKNFVGVDDYDLWLRIAEKYKIGAVRKSLIVWRSHPDSISSSREIKMHQGKINVLKKFYKKMSDKKSQPAADGSQVQKFKEETRQSIAKTYEDIGILYFRNKKWKLAKKYFRKAKKEIPLRFKVWLALGYLKTRKSRIKS